ncbi:VTT domain-containing protein [Sagittula stellata]
MRRIYDWTMAQAGGQHALLALAFVSFIEASIFPIPPDVLMIPMILAAPSRAWLIALVATGSSVLGGLFGYGIGFFFFETLGQPILEFFGKADKMAEFNATFNGAGFWAVLIAGVTPFPFKVITIMSGWTAMPLATFLTTALVARAIRFFVVAGLLYAFGAPIRDFIERYLGLVFTLFVALLVGGFLVLRYI